MPLIDILFYGYLPFLIVCYAIAAYATIHSLYHSLDYSATRIYIATGIVPLLNIYMVVMLLKAFLEWLLMEIVDWAE